jgi:hypothetical protein
VDAVKGRACSSVRKSKPSLHLAPVPARHFALSLLAWQDACIGVKHVRCAAPGCLLRGKKCRMHGSLYACNWVTSKTRNEISKRNDFDMISSKRRNVHYIIIQLIFPGHLPCPVSLRTCVYHAPFMHDDRFVTNNIVLKTTDWLFLETWDSHSRALKGISCSAGAKEAPHRGPLPRLPGRDRGIYCRATLRRGRGRGPRHKSQNNLLHTASLLSPFVARINCFFYQFVGSEVKL